MNCRKHRKEIGKVAKKEKEKFPSLSESLFFLRFDKSGFTMIEMVIVLVIISVIIMLAYSQLRTPHEKAACQYIYSQMQLAKMNAVATGSNNTVDLDTLFDGYDDVDVPEDANFLASDPGSYPSGETAFPADGINFGTNNIVSFTSKGMAEESGSSDNGAAYIYDVNNSSRMCAVTVLSTGMIRLWTSIDSGATWS
jgi:prepilin-type N-terminal cleavage/methylation domain-containing protein|tara:strand:+ start:830 stop:1417 length:588 start_codon:yes stop_codon:yes gene_type:complete